MKVVLVDNGSLEAAAHEGLRAAATSIGANVGVPVEAVSWKHSDRIPPPELRAGAARTLAPWMRSQVAGGEREFVFIPFFVSPQGAIGSALRADLGRLQDETGGFDYSFTQGLSAGDALSRIIADRVREASAGLRQPAVVVVDHGGPSLESAQVRNRVADAARAELGGAVGSLAAASMESPEGPGYDFNRPLLADLLASLAGPAEVVIAPLFLLPGRHAGPGGDIERIARSSRARFRTAGLVGSHPIAIESLSAALSRALGAGALS